MYGASSNEYRNVMPNYLLQWEQIKVALENKCDIYDFRGVSGHVDEGHPQYGIYKFKKGFNGDFVEFVGELRMVTNPFMDFVYEKLVRKIRGFKIRARQKKENKDFEAREKQKQEVKEEKKEEPKS